MPSSRKSERRRSREASSPKPVLRMDQQNSRDRSHRSSHNEGASNSGRAKELDSVMKKARRGGSQSNYWNKRLLEVEEKDPNRWRHSGYKELYHGEKKSKSGSRSRSRSKSAARRSGSGSAYSRSRSGSPRHRSPRSPRPHSPRDRSPGPRSPRPRSPRPRSPRPRSPRPRTPPSPPPSSRSPNRRRRPPSPRGRSDSYSSSDSSCSDDSCSVCSPKNSRNHPRDSKRSSKWSSSRSRVRDRERRGSYRPHSRSRSRSKSFSVPRYRSRDRRLRKNADPRTWSSKDRSVLRPRHIKVESDSESSESGTIAPSHSGGPRLSLSERFGKMAQWSVDRDIEHRNLRITSGDRFTVEMDSPPSPPNPSLLALAEYGCWDDVRTRYAYYKKQGWLRDLTLQDYLRWEQWWYKYQDWLDGERPYDRYESYHRRRL